LRAKDPYEIKRFDHFVKEAEKEGKAVEDIAEPIPDYQIKKVRKMNRHERRAWLSKQRKKRKEND